MAPAPELSLRHLPDSCDVSLSFQIPTQLADISDNLLATDGHDFLIGDDDDSLSTPFVLKKSKEPWQFSELTSTSDTRRLRDTVNTQSVRPGSFTWMKSPYRRFVNKPSPERSVAVAAYPLETQTVAVDARSVQHQVEEVRPLQKTGACCADTNVSQKMKKGYPENRLHGMSRDESELTPTSHVHSVSKKCHLLKGNELSGFAVATTTSHSMGTTNEDVDAEANSRDVTFAARSGPQITHSDSDPLLLSEQLCETENVMRNGGSVKSGIVHTAYPQSDTFDAVDEYATVALDSARLKLPQDPGKYGEEALTTRVIERQRPTEKCERIRNQGSHAKAIDITRKAFSRISRPALSHMAQPSVPLTSDIRRSIINDNGSSQSANVSVKNAGAVADGGAATHLMQQGQNLSLSLSSERPIDGCASDSMETLRAIPQAVNGESSKQERGTTCEPPLSGANLLGCQVAGQAESMPGPSGSRKRVSSTREPRDPPSDLRSAKMQKREADQSNSARLTAAPASSVSSSRSRPPTRRVESKKGAATAAGRLHRRGLPPTVNDLPPRVKTSRQTRPVSRDLCANSTGAEEAKACSESARANVDRSRNALGINATNGLASNTRTTQRNEGPEMQMQAHVTAFPHTDKHKEKEKQSTDCFTFQTDLRMEVSRSRLIKQDEGVGSARGHNSRKENHAVARRPIIFTGAASADHEPFHPSHDSLRPLSSSCTVPTGVPLHTELRLRQRRAFDEAMRTREEEVARLEEQRRREREEEEAREVKEMRRQMVPRANELPEWYATLPRRGPTGRGEGQ